MPRTAGWEPASFGMLDMRTAGGKPALRIARKPNLHSRPPQPRTPATKADSMSALQTLETAPGASLRWRAGRGPAAGDGGVGLEIP